MCLDINELPLRLILLGKTRGGAGLVHVGSELRWAVVEGHVDEFDHLVSVLCCEYPAGEFEESLWAAFELDMFANRNEMLAIVSPHFAVLRGDAPIETDHLLLLEEQRVGLAALANDPHRAMPAAHSDSAAACGCVDVGTFHDGATFAVVPFKHLAGNRRVLECQTGLFWIPLDLLLEYGMATRRFAARRARVLLWRL